MIKTNVKGWSISSELIITEAQKLGYEIEIINQNKNLFYIKKDKKKILFKNIDGGFNSLLGFKLSEDKELTYNILGLNNLPISKSIYLDINEKGNFDFDNLPLNYPLVVKPVDEGHGNGVTVNILDKETLINSINFAFSFSSKIIIQNYIVGDDHRVLVVGDKIVAVAKRVPPSIIGNGLKTIKGLIDDENKNPLRGDKDHDKPLSTIKIDKELNEYLDLQGFSLETILEKDKEIFLRRNANLSTGGRSIDLTDVIHPNNIQICIEACKLCQLKVAGVDIITTDISKPLRETSGVIIEINSTPGLRMHHFPSEGTSRNVAGEILKLI
ncbi:MAG: hypothetical protein PHE25_02850 [Candidatus Gracilibacteria bacterium]|nr:hypothetical protein [Candidatus Gracilibacteria bacterium]